MGEKQWTASAMRRALTGLLLGWAGMQSAQAQEPQTSTASQELDAIAVDVATETGDDKLTRDSDAVELEEVVVTSQKIKQSLRQVPASVSAISGEALKNSKILVPNDLNGYVPNMQMRVSPFAGEIRIRGYGTPASNVGFESSVGVIIDDVYYGRSGFLNALMYDVDRVEVIRGAQGALFGKNTIAGVVNLATVEPDQFTAGDVTVLMRDDMEIRDARGGVSVPIADGIYSRIGGAVTAYDGLFYNTALGRREADLDASAGRGKLRFTNLFGEGELMLAVSAGSQKANGNLFQLSKATANSLALFRQYDPRAEADAYNNLLSSNVDSRVEIYTDTAQANFRYPFGSVLGLTSLDLTSVTAYAKNDVRQRSIDFDFSPIPAVRLDLVKPTPYTQYSQELRFTGSAPSLFGFFGKTEFIAGGYYLRSNLLSNDLVMVEDLGAAAALVIASRSSGFEDVPIGGPLAEQFSALIGRLTSGPLDDALLQGLANRERATLLLDQKQEAYSAYGQVTTYLTERFAGILGWRLGRETKDGHMSSQAPQGAIFLPAVLGQANHDSYLSRSENESSPKVGIKYDLTPKTSTYLMYAKGFKGGGFNALPFNANNLQYEPERANTYEGGIKSRLFGNTLDANLAVYYTRFDNLQVSVFDGTTFNIQNAASAETQGFEGDIRWLSPFPGTQLIANVGYSDASYRHYPNGPAPAGAEEGDPRISQCPGANAMCQDLSGQTLPSAPKWTASLIPQLSLPGFSPGWGFQFSVEALYTSKRYLDADLDENTLQDETIQLNARVSMGAKSGAWSFSVFGSNLTEEGILAQVSDQPVGPGNYGAVRQDRGREFYGVVRLNF